MSMWLGVGIFFIIGNVYLSWKHDMEGKMSSLYKKYRCINGHYFHAPEYDPQSLGTVSCCPDCCTEYFNENPEFEDSPND